MATNFELFKKDIGSVQRWCEGWRAAPMDDKTQHTKQLFKHADGKWYCSRCIVEREKIQQFLDRVEKAPKISVLLPIEQPSDGYESYRL